VRDGKAVVDASLGVARDLVASGLRSLPWEGLMLSHGDPAIPTTQIPARHPQQE
jgi:nicotinate phosphoribosyltransferase